MNLRSCAVCRQLPDATFATSHLQGFSTLQVLCRAVVSPRNCTHLMPVSECSLLSADSVEASGADEYVPAIARKNAAKYSPPDLFCCVALTLPRKLKLSAGGAAGRVDCSKRLQVQTPLSHR